MIKKKYIRLFTKSAKELAAQTRGTMVVYNVYADACFALDTEDDNIIDVCRTEEEAIEQCEGINSGEFSDDGSKSDVYYKAFLIDADTGEKITRKNIKNYLKPQFKHLY